MKYVVRRLTSADAESLDKFLRSRTAEAYYLRSNAKAGGLIYDGKFYQAEYLGAFLAGKLMGVVSFTWLNTILVYAADLNCLPELCAALIPLIQNRHGHVEAFLGLAPQVNNVIHALKIPSQAFRRNDTDGLFRLRLETIRIPNLLGQTACKVRRAEMKDYQQIVSWRVAFDIEALHATPDASLEKKAAADMNQRMKLRELFVLEENNKIIALCSAGGYVPEAIIIGSVWTPMELRGKGYGRTVTAGAIKILADERPAMRLAVLTAIQPNAIRAYEAIGFERIADWRLALVKENYRIACPS